MDKRKLNNRKFSSHLATYSPHKLALPKNQQFSTIQDMPPVSLPYSDFIQGPRYDTNAQINSNLKMLALQKELAR